MKKVGILDGLKWFSLTAILFCAASNSIAAAQEAKNCPEKKAVGIVRANPAVTAYCKGNAVPRRYVCSFKARRTSPLNEKSDPDAAWYVIASTPELAFVEKVSQSCQMMEKTPLFLKPIELGSIELGVFESTDIVIGKVVDVKSPEPVISNGGAKLQTEAVTVEVSRVLKGKPAPKVTFDNGFAWPKDSAKQWLNSDHEMLFFISRGELAGSADNPGCQFLAQNAGQNDTQRLAALQACQNCIDTAQKAWPGEDQQMEALKSCITKIDIQSDIGNQVSLIFQGLEGKPKLFYKSVLLGNWPNGIDLETGNHSIYPAYPVFSKTGDMLRTGKDILNAVQAELTIEARKPYKGTDPVITSSGQLGEETELSPDKYPQAYDAGIPKNSLVILDIPPR